MLCRAPLRGFSGSTSRGLSENVRGRNHFRVDCPVRPHRRVIPTGLTARSLLASRVCFHKSCENEKSAGVYVFYASLFSRLDATSRVERIGEWRAYTTFSRDAVLIVFSRELLNNFFFFFKSRWNNCRNNMTRKIN